MFEKLKELFAHRMTVWFVLGLSFLTAAVVASDALALPPLFQVALYKGFLLFAAAHAGYWIDRVLFPYARPDQATREPSFDAACLRRAIIVAAVMVCVAFGA
ncbi:MAG: putative holin [Formosimonas sp.]